MKPRIAIITHELKGGGVGTMTWYLYQALIRSNRYQPSIILLATGRTDPASVRLASPSTWSKGVQCLKMDWRGIEVQHVGAWAVELEALRYRPRHVLDSLLQNFDLLQFVVGSAPWVCAAGRLTQPKMVWTATTTLADRDSRTRKLPLARRAWATLMISWATWAEKRGLESAATVFALSPYTAQQVERLAPKAKTRVVPCGVDTDMFKPAAEARNGYVLSVGRFSDARKNGPLLLDAYARVRQRLPQPPDLWLAGEPPTKEVLAEAERRGQLAGVYCVGKKRPEELAVLYQDASVFVLASDEEGQGIVILEAMACGLPVVSTRCGGPDSMVEPGRTGLLVPVGDAAALCEALVAILQSKERGREMGQMGRRVVLERFSHHVFADAFTSEYEQALRAR